MIRTLLAAAVLASMAAAPALAQQGAAATAPAQKFSVKTSTIGQILDNAEAKAAFAKVFPEVAASDQIEQGREYTVEAVAQFVPDAFPADKVKALEVELAKIK